jgi:streptogramin lyase
VTCKRLSGSAHHSRSMRVGLVALMSSVGILALLGMMWHPASSTTELAPSLSALSESLIQEAYLYHLDPDSGTFVTITLPSASYPTDVSVISDSLRKQVWFTEPGLRRIGRIVYTSSLDYVMTEFDVGGSPIALAASSTGVWFTLPEQNQVGHLDVASGTVTFIDLLSTQAGPADIAMGSSGQAWVTAREANRLASATISPTAAITEYVLPSNASMPEGVAPDSHGDVWFTSVMTGYVWRLTPPGGAVYLASPSFSDNSYPYRLALDSSGRVWATLANTNQLARLTPGTLPVIVTYTIPTSSSQPTAIGIDSFDHVFFAEQAAAKIGRLVVTSTASFSEYPLPQSGLKLTGLAVAEDNSVWAVAYQDIHLVYLPVVMRDYDSVLPPFGIQTYGSIGASTGFTRVVEAGARWLRFPIRWKDIETYKDTYNWGSLDASMQTIAASNIQVIGTIDYNPSWAAARPSGPVSNTADLQEFVGAVVARYPQVTYWEFYNEPDNKDFFGFDSVPYATMLQAVYPVVKSANPNAQVVMGGLALDWYTDENGPFVRGFLESVLSSCTGKSCFDVANFHYYPPWRPVWEPYGHDIIGKANYIRQLLVQYGYDSPLINTETSWPSVTIWGSPELQARYVPKVYARGLAAGLPVITWFALLDADSYDPGLLGPGLTPRPSFAAYETFTSLMTGARFVRAILPSETGSVRIEGYQFSVSGPAGRKRLDIYWYDCPSMVTMWTPTDCADVAPLTINASQIAVIDKLGAKVVLDSGGNGHVSIPGGVGSSPIYVDYAP